MPLGKPLLGKLESVVVAPGPPQEPTIPAVINAPISCTFDGSYVWFCDTGNALAQKVSITNITPGVVAAVDMNAYDATITKARQVRYDPDSGYVFVCCHDSAKVIIIDPTTNTIVGDATLTVAGSTRARAVGFDGQGNFWAMGIPQGTNPGTTYLYKFAIGTGSRPLLASHEIPTWGEDLDFDGTYFWIGGGSKDYVVGASGVNGTITDLGGGVMELSNAGNFQSFALYDGSQIAITSATNPANIGVFPVVARIDATTLTFTNPSGMSEIGSVDYRFPDVRDGSTFINGGRLTRFNPADGTYVMHAGGDNYYEATPLVAFGSIWTGSGVEAIHRWDPAKFEPRDLTTPHLVAVSASGGFIQGAWAKDDTYIYTTDGYSGGQNIIKIDPGAGIGSETTVGAFDVSDAIGNGWLDGICLDGTYVWVTTRFGDRPGLLKVDPVTGDVIGLLNAPEPIIDPIFQQPISITYNGQHLWVADLGTPYISKVNRTNQFPGVVARTDLSPLGVTQCREIKYGNMQSVLGVACYDSGLAVLIDPNSGSVVGKVDVSPQRARSVTFNDEGSFFVLGQTGTTGSTIYKYTIADVQAAYPGNGTAANTFDYPALYLENIDFVWQGLPSDPDTFIWAGTGTGTQVVRIDQFTGATVTNTTTNNDPVYESFYVRYATGSGGDSAYSLSPGGLITWPGTTLPGYGPSDFPATDGVLVDEPNTFWQNIQGYANEGGSYIWLTDAASGHAYRYSLGAGTFTTTVATGDESLGGATFAKIEVWATVRSSVHGPGLVRIRTAAGREAVTFRIADLRYASDAEPPTNTPPPPSFIQAQWVEPVSLTFDGTYLWTADRGNALLHKVDPNATPIPAVVEIVDLSVPEPTVTATREIQYDSASGYLFVACFDSNFALIVNPANSQVVAKLPTGAYRCRSLTFDGAGNVWVSSVMGGGSKNSELRKFNIAAALADWPEANMPTVTYTYTTHHFEVLTFGGGYLWSTGGLNEHYRSFNPFMEGDAYDQTVEGGVVWRIDPADGTLQGHIMGGNYQAARAYYHNGNLWVQDGLKGVHIWDPAKFEPRDTNEPRFIPHPNGFIHAASFQCEPPADDGTTLWFGTGNVGWGDLTRVTYSPVGGETASFFWHNNFIVDSLCSLVFDGTHVWAVSRYSGGSSYPGHLQGLRRITTTPGSEDTDFRLLPGEAFIASASPHTVSSSGGTTITLQGWGFSTATEVRIAFTFDENDYATASDMVIVDDNTITFTMPPNPFGGPTFNTTVLVMRPTTNLRYARRINYT